MWRERPCDGDTGWPLAESCLRGDRDATKMRPMRDLRRPWLLASILVLTMAACGRTPSRYLGKEARQVLEVEGLTTDNFIDISFDKRGSATVKDVTFQAGDGYVYTVEFRDVSPFEGTIRWVPKGQKASVIQSRSLSRVFGTPVNLELPEDCARVLAVDVTYDSSNERTKNLTYLSSSGAILAKEYREGFVDRHLGGWLEVRGMGGGKPTQAPATPAPPATPATAPPRDAPATK